MTRAEILARLQASPLNNDVNLLGDIRTAFGLPDRVRQEDGIRETFEFIFQQIDADGELISLSEFRRFVERKMAGKNSSIANRAILIVMRRTLARLLKKKLVGAWKLWRGVDIEAEQRDLKEKYMENMKEMLEKVREEANLREVTESNLEVAVNEGESVWSLR